LFALILHVNHGVRRKYNAKKC